MEAALNPHPKNRRDPAPEGKTRIQNRLGEYKVCQPPRPTSKTLESGIRQVRIGAHENQLPFTALVLFYCCCNRLCRFSDFFVSCGDRSDTHAFGRWRGAAGGPGAYNANV